MENQQTRISSHRSGIKVTLKPRSSATSFSRINGRAEEGLTITKRQEKTNGHPHFRMPASDWEKAEEGIRHEERRYTKRSWDSRAWKDRSFSWSLSDKNQEIVEWSSPNNPFVQKRFRVPPRAAIGQLLLSIVAAILVGLVMGFSILRIFFLENASHSARSIDDHLPKQNVVVEKPPIGQKDVKEAAKESGIPLPSLRVVMLQAGHFQSKQHAQKKVNEYRLQGLAAVMSEDPPYRIFLGLGLTRDDALKLSAIYQKKEVEVFLKEWQAKGHSPQNMKGKEKLIPLLESGYRLMQQLGKASVANIQSNPERKAPAFAFQTIWEKEYRQIVTDYRSLEKVLSPSLKDALSQCIAALDLAIQSGVTAHNRANPVLMWQIQEGLVRYALAYEQVVGVMAKDGENKF